VKPNLQWRGNGVAETSAGEISSESGAPADGGENNGVKKSSGEISGAG
jgi:hypothetical protein